MRFEYIDINNPPDWVVEDFKRSQEELYGPYRKDVTPEELERYRENPSHENMRILFEDPARVDAVFAEVVESPGYKALLAFYEEKKSPDAKGE